MTEHPTRQITGEVFSAAHFFERYALQGDDADGSLSFTLPLPSSGIHYSAPDHGTLVWVDGVCADSLAQERFMALVQRGEIPEPLQRRATRAVQTRIRYVSPEKLTSTRSTVLSACGLLEAVCDSALASPHCECPRCGAMLSRFSTSADMFSAIVLSWRGKKISISATAPGARFHEWVQSHGLILQANSSTTPSVHLDQRICDESSMIALSALVDTAWRIPEVRFTCTDGTGASQSYSPYGWCSTCNVIPAAASRAKLATLLLRGLDDAHTTSPEALLGYSQRYTVRELLCTPVAELDTTHDAPTSRVIAYLSALALGTLSLGARTDRLDADHLALVTLVASIMSVKSPHDHMVLDLPSNLLTESSTCAARALLEHEGAQRGISLVKKSFVHEASTAPSADRALFSGPPLATFSLPALAHTGGAVIIIHAGELLCVRRSEHATTGIFQTIASQLSTSIDQIGQAAHLVTIPVFQMAPAGPRVFGDEVGLLEGLARLYAASLDARTHGLTQKDFTLFGTRSPRYICGTCRGLGVVVTPDGELPRPLAAPCPVCNGARCKPPVGTAMFRGVSFSNILNQSIERSTRTLAALAKAKRALDLIATLKLQHIPLGMPLALLSSSELRRLAVVRALLHGRATKPTVVMFESPHAGLHPAHHAAICEVRDSALKAGSVGWIEIESIYSE